MSNQESKNKVNKKLPLLLVSILAVGCGGGGDDENPSIDKPSIENPKPEIEKPEPEVEHPLPENNVGGSFEEAKPLNTLGGNNITNADTSNNYFYVDLSKGDEIHLYYDFEDTRGSETSEDITMALYPDKSVGQDFENIIKGVLGSKLVYKSDKNQRIKVYAGFEGNLYASIDYCDKSKNKGVLGTPGNPVKITQKDVDERKEFEVPRNPLKSYYVIDAKKGANYTFKTPIIINNVDVGNQQAIHDARLKCSEYIGVTDAHAVGLSTDGGYTYNCDFSKTRGLRNGGEFVLKYDGFIKYGSDDKVLKTTFKIIEQIKPDTVSPDTSNTGTLENNYGGTIDMPTKLSIKGNNIIQHGVNDNNFYIDVKKGDRLYLHAVFDVPYSEGWLSECKANDKAGITLTNIKFDYKESSCTNTLIYDIHETGKYMVNTGFNGVVEGNLYADIVRDDDPSTIGALGRPSNPIQIVYDKFYPLGRNQLNNYYQFTLPYDYYDYEVELNGSLFSELSRSGSKEWYANHKERTYGISWDGGLNYETDLRRVKTVMWGHEDITQKFNFATSNERGENLTGHFIVEEPHRAYLH